MPIITEPFQRTRLDEERAKDKSEVITLRLNKDERKLLDEAKQILEQPKDSTAIKTLFQLGCYDVIQHEKTKYLISTLFKNKRNNQRIGITEFE